MAGPEPGFFGRLAGAVMDHPRVAGMLLLAVTLIAVVGVTRLRVNPNILELLPAGDPTTQAIHQLNAEEGGANLLTIAARGDDPASVDAFLAELSATLEARDDVDFALYGLDEELSWRLGLIQLTPDELTLIRDRLRGAVAMGPAAANPFVASRLLDLGPLTEKLAEEPRSPMATDEEGVGRVLVRPLGSAYDGRFAQPFMADIYATIDALDPAATGVEIAWVGGAYRHAVEDVEGIRHDLGWTGLGSALAVLTLVAVAFRDVRAILLIFVPLVAANIWTSGFVGAGIGTLNTFTSFFPAILVGLGVDFSIHLYSRYREERAHGGELRDAVVRAWDKSGPPCATAALTSAGGFCALWAAGFQGFQQLGTILAVGILFCLAAVLVTLPLLIRWREKAPQPAPLRRLRVPARRRPPTYRLAPLGLLLAILVSIAAATRLPQVGFQYDMSELRRDGQAYDDLDEQRRALARDSYAPVVVSYPDDSSLQKDHIRLSAAIEDGTLPQLSRVLSLSSILPVDQETRVALLKEIGLLSGGDQLQYLPPNIRRNLGRISGSQVGVVTREDLPKGLRHVLGAGGENHRMLLMPTGNMWDLRENVGLYNAVQEFVGDRPAAGEYLAMAVLYRLVEGDAPRIAILALLVVLSFTMIDLRSPRRALGAVGALVMGMCWAGAGMSAFRIDLSVVNFVGIPILMGIGVDVVIHMLHRMREEGPGRVRVALATTGWASGLSASTTVLSFAALNLASSQGVRGLGQMIVLGLTLVTVAAFVVVPLGWMTAWKVRGELPTDPEA